MEEGRERIGGEEREMGPEESGLEREKGPMKSREARRHGHTPHAGHGRQAQKPVGGA